MSDHLLIQEINHSENITVINRPEIVQPKFPFTIELSKSRGKYKVLRHFDNEQSGKNFIIQYAQQNIGKAWTIRLRDNHAPHDCQIIMLRKFKPTI